MSDFPLLIEFTRGTRVYREPVLTRTLPMVQNGPPGTFVLFPDGLRVPLPTDQIVHADDVPGAAYVAFGGMRFEGLVDDSLVFSRVRDLLPPDQLSPERGRRMTLAPQLVSSIRVDGRLAWSSRPQRSGDAG